MATSKEQLHALIDRLSAEDQKRLLTYAQELTQRQPFPHTPLPVGSPPDALLRMTVTPEIGATMQRALEDCERVHPEEWE